MPGRNWLINTLSMSLRLILLASILVSCSPVLKAKNENVETKDTELSSSVYAAVLFHVTVPDDLTDKDERLYLDVLDEVTGIGLNPKRYPMEKSDDLTYSVRIPVVVGSVVKYRYTRGDSPPAIEYTPDREQVRYRLFYATASSEAYDQISGWIDQPYQSAVGRLQGTVVDIQTNQPVANALITAGGVQTLSSADGSFLLEGLPVGTQNLVIYCLNGEYGPFQQGAVIAADSTTPASITLQQPPHVNITFVVKPPQDSISGIPIRMIGNIYSLGNTFADLEGGVNTISSRTPLMSLTSDGMYFLTLSLPVGLDLRYKYTLGDGFWNAEHKSDGSFFTRQLIVPGEDIIIEDTIETWKTGPSSDVISFFVEASDDTPENDTLSIQFSPYSWMEPIPMWPMGNQEWLYVLYGPLNIDTERVLYRFCRNDQCGLADDEATHDDNAGFDYFDPSVSPQTVEYQIKNWSNWQVLPTATSTISESTPRENTFWTGVELQKGYQPNWQPYINWSIEKIKELNAGWIIETPTWSYTRNNLPVLELVPGEDALIFDEEQVAQWVSQKNIKLAIYPMVNYSGSNPQEWWQNAERDAGWWQSWFDRYRSYILNFADMANKLNAGAIILGEDSLKPALPDGVLFDGAPSGVPSSASKYWTELITDVRGRFNGNICWAIDYDGGVLEIPEFISQVDTIYLQWSAPIQSDSLNTQSMVDEFNLMLERDIYPLKETYQKPIIIAIDYPSSASISAPQDNGNTMDEQARLYDGLLSAIQQHSWVDGVISRGFYKPVALQDSSSSVYGKQAFDILQQWFLRLSPNGTP